MNGKFRCSVVAKSVILALSTSAGILLFTACNNPPPSDQQLQEQAAQATEKAKQESAKALADARVAAANAEKTVNDVAAGVRQGLNSKDTPGSGSRLDLNDASEGDLTALPGVSDGKARQIIHHRPYTSTHDLVKQGLLTEGQFDAIAQEK